MESPEHVNEALMTDELKHLLRLAALHEKAWTEEMDRPDHEIDWDRIHALEDDAVCLLHHLADHYNPEV